MPIETGEGLPTGPMLLGLILAKISLKSQEPMSKLGLFRNWLSYLAVSGLIRSEHQFKFGFRRH